MLFFFSEFWAYFHFYGFLQHILYVHIIRVNALNGLTSISTDWWSKKGYLGDLCQCPQRAYFHFYYQLMTIERFLQWVSMPSTGLLPFLRWKNMMNRTEAEACQCPQRAYFHFYGSLSEPLILLASESYFYK